MATHTNVEHRTALAGGERIITGILGGLLGGVLFAMWMMLQGLFDQGFFSAPTAIWAFWAGPSAYHPRDFEFVSLFLGMMGHMMNSVMLGIAMVLVGTLSLRGALPTLLLSLIKALVVMVLMFAIVLRLSPNGAIVYNASSLWSWIVGHLMFGLGVWFATWRRGAVPT